MQNLPKNMFTDSLRVKINCEITFIRETDRSEPDLAAISYESIQNPLKRAWITTYQHKRNGITIDCELYDSTNNTANVIKVVNTHNIKEIISELYDWLID